MKLALFDIDGTVVDSINADDRCFLEAIAFVFGLELVDVNWASFPHVTDEGLTREIVQRHLQRPITEAELQTMKRQFTQLIAVEAPAFTEIKGAVSFISQLQADPEFEVAFATGGWKETAEIKLMSVGIDPSDFILKSSSNFMSRENIVSAALEASKKLHSDDFKAITYFGDGVWDHLTTNKLGLNFIGIDAKDSKNLENIGAKRVVKDFSNPILLRSWL